MPYICITNNRKMKKLLYKYSLILLIVAGCSVNNSNDLNHEFKDDIWKRFENPVMEMEISSPGIVYDMWVAIDFEPGAAPNSIPITIIMTTPSGEVRSRDLHFNFHSIQGQEESGTRVKILRKGFAFTKKGVCTFEIENRSQKIETPGMKGIRIWLEKGE